MNHTVQYAVGPQGKEGSKATVLRIVGYLLGSGLAVVVVVVVVPGAGVVVGSASSQVRNRSAGRAKLAW